MFAVDAVPYFPLELKLVGSSWIANNPVTGSMYELNSSAYWLLHLCDGYRTWGEIIEELKRASHASKPQIIKRAEPLLKALSKNGMLWWRRQRMQWWDLPPPIAVLWDLTSRCNLLCHHCVVSASRRTREELSLEECKRLVNELAAFGVQELIMSGGEPMMRCDFFEIAKYAAERGFSLQLATNATLITKQGARRLAAIGVNAQVSLDGATPEVHDDFRQCHGSWERTVQGIRHLVAAGVPLKVAAAVTKANISQIPALYELTAALGAHTFRILPFVPFGRGREAQKLEVSPQEMQEVTMWLRQRREEGGISVASMEFECTFDPPPQEQAHPQTRIGCDGAVAYCTITSSGEVLPCNFFAGVEAENVKEKSFAWIWKNSRFLNYFRSLTISDIEGACQKCAWLPTCRGSCIAANFAHGDVFQANCHCWLVNAPATLESNHGIPQDQRHTARNEDLRA